MLVEELEHLLRRSGEYCSVASHDDRTLHEHGMFEEKLDDLVTCLVVGLVQPQLLEVLVLSDKVRRRVGKHPEDAFEVGTAEGFIEILDDVELDATFTQDLLRAAGLPSAGVVVHHQPVHGCSVGACGLA